MVINTIYFLHNYLNFARFLIFNLNNKLELGTFETGTFYAYFVYFLSYLFIQFTIDIVTVSHKNHFQTF